MMRTGAAVVGAALLCGSVGAADGRRLEGDDARVNYSLGYQMGEDLERQNLGFSPEAMARGIRDAAAGVEPLLSVEEMRSTLRALKRSLVADQRLERRRAAERKRTHGAAFLAENAGKDGGQTTDSGLQYKILREGTGNKPGPQGAVRVHYRGTLLDGREFDSSYRDDEPRSFPVNGVIPGWTEALQRMREGAKWELYIPPDLGYDERDPLKDETLVFEIELISANGE